MQFKLPEATQLFQRTPATVASMVAGLPDAWMRTNEGDSTWSCYDIVGHLIHGERTDWIPRARIILEHGTSCAFEPFDRFAQLRTDQTLPISMLLEQFASLRTDNLKALDELQLTAQDLARPGTHPELGPVTLGQLLSAWVVHDLAHISQMARVTAKQYSQEVGPWTPYLSILKG